MAVSDAHVFPGFLTPVLTQPFFPNPPTTFLTCFCRGERRKYAGKKVRLNRGSNSQPPGHESDTLTTEPSGRGPTRWSYSPNGRYRIGRFIFSFLLRPSTKILQWNKILGRIWRGPLTHSYTMTPFDAPGKQAFWKQCGKRRNCS